MSFSQWLRQQFDRRDATGALAKAVDSMEGPTMKSRQRDEHKLWAEFLTRRGSIQHILAFNEAWAEFLLAKEAQGEMS